MTDAAVRSCRLACFIGGQLLLAACNKNEAPASEATESATAVTSTPTASSEPSGDRDAPDVAAQLGGAGTEEPASGGGAPVVSTGDVSEGQAEKGGKVEGDESEGDESEGDRGKASPPDGAGKVSAPAPKRPTAPEKEKATKPPAPTAPVYDGDSPCRAKSFEFAQVRQSCREGGVPKAKDLMKYLVKKGKAEGNTFKCSSCHDDTKTYTTKPKAAQDLRKLL